MLQQRSEHMRAWESAEISRSVVEAQLTRPAHAGRLNSRTLQRYQNPPADTWFPLEYAYHLLGDVRGRRVVDFGCGSGANSVHIALRGAALTGLDISESLIRLARQRLDANGVEDTARFVVGSAHDLPFETGSVDVVFGIAILHHLDLDLVAREVHRILKPRGRAIFQEPVRNSRVLHFLRQLIPYRAPDISPFERPLTDAELQAFASRFSSVRMKAFTLPFVKLAMFIPSIARNPGWWYRLDSRLLARLPFLRTYASVRVFEVIK
ncbi:MAG: class I SAM-dependent methyltransferase [Vicinamibacterales bacterium]